MSALAIVLLAWLMAIAGYIVGAAYPPCCPGAQQGCNMADGSLGVRYCREHAFGWEPCQRLDTGGAYPQALWRGKVDP